MELGTASGLDHPSVQQALLQAIQDPSSDVRAEAAKSLPASLGSQEAARKLTAMMKDDAEISVRRAAIAALARTPRPPGSSRITWRRRRTGQSSSRP
jgi:HEAT repeat protein